jgi:hypothetical protein
MALPRPLALRVLAGPLLPQLPQPPLPLLLTECLMQQLALPARRRLTLRSLVRAHQKLQRPEQPQLLLLRLLKVLAAVSEKAKATVLAMALETV